MGLSAYNIHFVAYQILVVCLAIETCMISAAIYLVICRFKYPNLYGHYACILLQFCMFASSIIILGLLASLTEYWQQPECTFSFRLGYRCSPYEKRKLRTQNKRDTTSYITYSGALIAGSVLSSFELILWAVTTGIAAFDKWKDLKAASQANASPPQVKPNEEAIPSVTPALKRSPLSDDWDSTTQLPTAHRPGPEPLLPDEDFVTKYPPPMRLTVTNQERRPLSTPVFEVPSYLRTPISESIVHETVANVHVPVAPPVLPRINATYTSQRYEAYNPNADAQCKPAVSRPDQ